MPVINVDVSDRTSSFVKILGLYPKLYQINRASALKHITLTSQNFIDNTGNGFVHGKYIILTGLSLYLLSD